MFSKDDIRKVDHKPYIVYTDNPDNELDSSDIPALSVTTGKIAPFAVTESKLANGSVTGDKIADGTITSNDISSEIAGDFPGLTVGNSEFARISDELGWLDDDTGTWARRASLRGGTARVERLLGRTVVWNQLVNTPYFNDAGTYGGVAFSVASDGTITASGTSNASINFKFKQPVNLISGHKYLMAGTKKLISTSQHANVTIYDNTNANIEARITTATDIIFTASNNTSNAQYYFNMSAANEAFELETLPQLFDLTAMFGAGNEPATVAEFERMFTESYYPYDAGSLLSVNAVGVESVDANGDTLSTRAIPIAEYFTGGMKSAGSVRDELTEDAAVTRVGVRAYQSGDENDATLTTDGSTWTHYPLSTPTETAIEPQLNLTYPVETGGTESLVLAEGANSAPPTWEVVYAYDADGIVDKALSVIAPLEGETVSANYAVDSYLIHDETLYRVTSAIATGESIVPGTNVTATTVMGELVRLTT